MYKDSYTKPNYLSLLAGRRPEREKRAKTTVKLFALFLLTIIIFLSSCSTVTKCGNSKQKAKKWNSYFS